MSTVPKDIYIFKAIIIKIPIAFFTEIRKGKTKMLGNYKRPQIANVRKRPRAGGITLPDFELYYKAIVNKIVCYWH